MCDYKSSEDRFVSTWIITADGGGGGGGGQSRWNTVTRAGGQNP